MKYNTRKKIKELMEKIHVFEFFHNIYRIHYKMLHIKSASQSKKRAAGKIQKEYLKLKEYQNIHKGERCFIIATGPSLTLSDVEALRNEYTFSMNSICKLFDDTDWRPTYYVIQDHIVFDKLKDDKNFQSIETKFVADFIFSEHKIENSNYIKYPLDHLDHMDIKKHTLPQKFSEDAYVCVYDGWTVTYSAMQIAVYMGFTEIYLIGCDCDYSGEKQHFADFGIKVTDNPENRMLSAYAEARRFADSHGFKIFNATRGGKLEIFERADLDDVLQKNT